MSNIEKVKKYHLEKLIEPTVGNAVAIAIYLIELLSKWKSRQIFNSFNIIL